MAGFQTFGRGRISAFANTSKEDFFRGKRLYEYPKHWEWVEQTLAADPAARWKFVFCHHPPFCAGPTHHNTDRMQKLLPLFERAGVRVVLNGHEHNFQHSRHAGIDYLVTGAGSKLDKRTPQQFAEAHTVSWSNHAHFLLVTIEGRTMTVRVIGELDETKADLPDGMNADLPGTKADVKVGLYDTSLRDVPRFTPSGEQITGPIALTL